MLTAHHDDSGDSSFILSVPCHGVNTEPSNVNTSGYSKFLVVFEASIDRVQTAIENRLIIVVIQTDKFRLLKYSVKNKVAKAVRSKASIKQSLAANSM